MPLQMLDALDLGPHPAQTEAEPDADVSRSIQQLRIPGQDCHQHQRRTDDEHIECNRQVGENRSDDNHPRVD